MADVAAWSESQLRKYDFPTNQLPRLSCKDKTVCELLKAGVSIQEIQQFVKTMHGAIAAVNDAVVSAHKTLNWR